METFKKIGKVALDILIVLVFVISVILVISNITSDKENGGQPNVFGYVISSVQSESMSGTFEKGALVVGKVVKEDTVIEKGDIISFHQTINGIDVINTHRVVDIFDNGTEKFYQTQGDNRKICPVPDSAWKSIEDIAAVYKFDIPGVGGFIDFLKKPVGFILCLVLPMVAFIAWQVYKLIALYLQGKKQQMLEEAKVGVSDEAKDAIIREYLAKMQADANADGNVENKEESTADNGEDNT